MPEFSFDWFIVGIIVGLVLSQGIWWFAHKGEN